VSLKDSARSAGGGGSAGKVSALSDSVVETEQSPRRAAVGNDRPYGRESQTSWRRYTALLVVMDAACVLAGALSAQVLRFGEVTALGPAPWQISYAAMAGAMVPAWLAMIVVGGCYERRYLEGGSEEFRRVFDAAMRFLALFAVVALIAKIDVARAFIVISIPLATVLILLERYAARRWLHHQRAHGRFMKRAVLVGSPTSCHEVAERLCRSPFAGLTVAGVCSDTEMGLVDVDGQIIEVLAEPHDVFLAAQSARANAIVVADSSTLSGAELNHLAWQLEGTGVALLVSPSVTDVTGPRIAIRPAPGLPLLNVEEPELSGGRRFVKAAFDRVAALVVLAVLLPLLAVIAVIIRISTKGPALFRQERVGLGGRQFTLWKFRTMVVDAEEQLPSMLHLNQHDGLLFKITDDPRITRIGRFLRRWSLDEVPQLWNVVRGDMSIVGPRPPLPSEVERYTPKIRRRLLVKPGMTGLWQVSGRSHLPWEESVRMDLYYVEHWSPALDALILARTLSAVLLRRGAY